MSSEETHTTILSLPGITAPAAPVVTMPDLNKETLRASVIIGTVTSIAEELEKYFGGVPYYRLDPNLSFRDQLDRLVGNSKYRESHYVYGMVSYGCSIPDDKLTEDMKPYPKAVREYRVQRVEIHR